MKNSLHIDQIYLDLIKSKVKQHEYRLANPNRRNIKVGDIISLESNIESIDVKVTSISIYKNWSDALKSNWKTDFKGVYSSLEECINACSKFYDEKDVEKYGIIVFTIKLI